MSFITDLLFEGGLVKEYTVERSNFVCSMLGVVAAKRWRGPKVSDIDRIRVSEAAS